MGTVTGETGRGGRGQAAREGSSWGKEAKEQLGVQKKLSRAVTELVCPGMDSRVREQLGKGAAGSGGAAGYLSTSLLLSELT